MTEIILVFCCVIKIIYFSFETSKVMRQKIDQNTTVSLMAGLKLNWF
jgi:hypothetical protein